MFDIMVKNAAISNFYKNYQLTLLTVDESAGLVNVSVQCAIDGKQHKLIYLKEEVLRFYPHLGEDCSLDDPFCNEDEDEIYEGDLTEFFEMANTNIR